MAEPTTVNYPSSYDDNTTLLGPLQERNVGTVTGGIGVDALQVTIDEEMPALTGPLFLLFEGGEIWFVEDADITVSGGDTTFTIHDLDMRGYNGSPIQPHNAGELVYFSLHDAHINQLRKAIVAMQKYGFRVGTDAQRTAYTPAAGEAWLTSDTGHIYYCFTGGSWTRVDYTDHGDLAGLGDDDHTQYHNDTRATTWHSAQPGSHITGADAHNHYSTNQGSAVYRVHSGADASKGTPTVTGQLYFAIDTVAGGTLYISKDGVSWTTVSGVPSGAIAPFSGACPSGWTRYTAMDGKFLRAVTDAGLAGGTGGAASHAHEIRQIVQHYHTVLSGSGSTTNPGDHTHKIDVGSSSGSRTELATSTLKGASDTTGVGGGHSHTASIPATTTTTAGTSYPSTSTENTDPPYKEVVFCQKD